MCAIDRANPSFNAITARPDGVCANDGFIVNTQHGIIIIHKSCLCDTMYGIDYRVNKILVTITHIIVIEIDYNLLAT